MFKFNHINKVGVELEGAFAPNQIDPDAHSGFPNGGIKSEGMSRTPEEETIISRDALIIGERNSIPCENLTRLRKWVETYFPKLCNRSNGFHIHVSFKKDDLRTKVIASKEFHRDFLEAAKKFVLDPKHKFNNDMIERVVHGRCSSASHYYNPEHRGAVHALSHHGTCEFRVFSGSLNPVQAKKCITFLVNFVEEYLEEHLQKEGCKSIGIPYQSYTGQVI